MRSIRIRRNNPTGFPTRVSDVASAAEVSVATVSRVFSSKGNVSPSTRERVLTAAKELGYLPPSVRESKPIRKRARNSQGRVAVRIADVAIEAGVSTATVSRVINGSPGVTRAVQRAVKEAIERLDYRRHHTAMSLGKGRTGYIAIVEPNGTQVLFSHQYGGRILAGIGRAIDRFPFRLVMTVNQDQFVSLLKSRSVDGIILIGAKPDASYQAELEGAQVSMVIVGSYLQKTNHVVMTPDYPEVLRISMKHLIDLGHHSIGYICGPRDSFRRDEDLGLFERLVRKSGVSHYGPIMLPEATRQCGYQAMTELLHNVKPRPTALISSADALSLGILEAARDHSIQVPQQMSLLSYGGIDQAAHSIPPLSTISGDIEAMGSDAVHLLVEMIEGKMPEKTRHVYPVKLILRETTGPPRSE